MFREELNITDSRVVLRHQGAIAKGTAPDRHRYWLGLVFLAILLLPLMTSSAPGFVYWSNKDGVANGFDWFNGGSDHGLFGDPILVNGNTLVFTPADFKAESVNGIADITFDRLQLGITAQPGSQLLGVRVTEYGSYDVNDQVSVSVSGTVFLTNLDLFEVQHDQLQTNPASPIGTGLGDWTAQSGIENIDWQNLQFVMNNNLIALSEQGTDSFIKKERVEIEIIIPEPATIGILTVGFVLILKKRNKKTVI